MKISGIVITKNEEANIRDCLESIQWLDEIIVVDSGSKDKTTEIARMYTDKVYSIDSENVTEKRKYSLNKSSYGWILFIDADERITEELSKEIQSLKTGGNDNIDGYYINRKNFYLGKWIKYCGLYPDYHLRLFRKDKAAVTDRVVHESIEVIGKSAKLKNDMNHYSYKDLYQMIRKINYYSTLEAEEHLRKNKKITKAGVFTHSISAFLRVYISRKGYKDRVYGFFVSFTDALTNLLTHLKLLKLQNKI